MDFTHFFDKMESQESYTILFISIIAFLFGLLVGFLLRAARVRSLKKELKETQQKMIDAATQLHTAQEELVKKNKALEEAQTEVRDMVDKMGLMEADKEKLFSQVYQLNTELEKIQATNRTYSSTIEELSDQIIGLKTQNEQLADDLEEARKTPTVVAAPAGNIQSETLNRLEIFEAKLDKLTAENEMLKARMSTVQSAANSSEAPPLVVGSITPKQASSEEPDLGINTEKSVMRKKILTDGMEKDDLTKISGVGPFIQQQLYDAGIYTYEQISHFDAARIESITREIGYFPGKIEKDDWVGQAKKLMLDPNPTPIPAKKSTYPTDDQDLKIIEGIGPKIEEILKTAGINNWTELSASSHKRLRAILDEAGSRYKMHDPETWCEQATLAANGKWEALKVLQDRLKGGRL